MTKIKNSNPNHDYKIEERLKNIELISSDFFWETDTDFKLTYVSEGIKDILGVSPESTVGKTPFNFMPEEEAIKFKKFLLNSADKIQLIKDVENWNYHKNGNLICLQINLAPILDKNNHIIGYRGVNKDITDRKRDEQKLKESEARYRNLFEKSNDAIIIYSFHGNILNVNSQTCKITGFTKEKLLSMSLKDLAASEEVCFNHTDITELEAPIFRECKIKKANKSFIEVEASVSLIDKEKELAQAILRDITARKEAEYNLAIEKAHFQQLFDKSPEAIAIINSKSQIIQINSEFTNLFGYSLDEIKGNLIDDIIAKPEQKQEAKHLTSLIKEGETISKEVIRYHKDGTPLNVSFLGTPLKTYNKEITSYGIYRDITKRKKIEQQLVKRDEILQAISHAAEIFLQSEEWEQSIEKIIKQLGIAANVHRIRIFQKTLDHKKNTLVSEKYSWHKKDYKIDPKASLLKNISVSDIGFERWLTTFQNGDIIYGLTKDFPEKEKRFLSHWNNLSILNIPLFVSGKLWGFIIFSDCENERIWSQVEINVLKTATNFIGAAIQRKLAEETRSNILEQLMNANEELKDFAYVVSHDLKAPLRGINTLANWISMDYADKFDEEGKQQMSLLINRVNRMHNLIEGILQYSRIGRVFDAKIDVNLNDLLPDVICSLAPPSNIKIEILNELPTVFAERVKIEQIFQNLLSNAIKFIDKPEGIISISSKKEDNFWHFCVADNGPGIEEKYFHKIFQIFQTLETSNDVKNTGIGLTLIKKIINTHGGKIWVESELGKGTIFHFTIPT